MKEALGMSLLVFLGILLLLIIIVVVAVVSSTMAMVGGVVAEEEDEDEYSIFEGYFIFKRDFLKKIFY